MLSRLISGESMRLGCSLNSDRSCAVVFLQDSRPIKMYCDHLHFTGN